MFVEVLIFIIAALGAFAFVRILEHFFDWLFNSKK